MRILAISTLVTLGFASASAADIQARFIESAPKDRFVFINASDCGLSDLVIELDLSTSKAGLIFDITAAGDGVEVFQPFELVKGADLVTDAPDVTDGMDQVALTVPNFPAGAEIAFTVDVDDTLDASDLGQIRVSGSEIEGASVRVAGAEGLFERSGRATLAHAGCKA